MIWIRRILLELWAIFVIAGVVGFMGPFGTYLNSSVADRVGEWWKLLMGAYLIVRPCIALLGLFARQTMLPSRYVVPWGVVALSAPLAFVWRAVGEDAYRHLDGYAALIPFSLLCGLAVLAATGWAVRAEARLAPIPAPGGREDQADRVDPRVDVSDEPHPGEPKLRARLPGSFQGPIIALEGEDHYVRVHGPAGNELLLMRLREAIAEMDGVCGEQIHRSWWVAKAGIERIEGSGRSWTVRLRNGTVAPVSRDSVERLRRAGLIPMNRGEAVTG